MSDLAMLPFHPVTGLQAIGFSKRGPIWPVLGGSEEGGDEGGSEGDESGEEGGAEGGEAEGSQDWWQFGSKADAEKWGNDLVSKRLQRERKSKLDPIVQERDTLKAELERIQGATKTDAQRREDELKSIKDELAEHRSYRAQQERNNLVRSIADEEGLPASFLSRVRGDDEDAIRDDIKDLLNVLSEGGSNTSTKKTPTTKAPKAKSGGGDSVSSGGGSSSDVSDDALAESILKEVEAQRKNGGLLVTRRSR